MLILPGKNEYRVVRRVEPEELIQQEPDLRPAAGVEVNCPGA